MDDLTVPNVFEFPFKPYKIQEDFMKQLYEVLEQKKCGIFESPTGTGKSLSIICSSIKWLKDHNAAHCKTIKNRVCTLEEEINKLEHEADWLTSQSKQIELSRELSQLKLEDEQIEKYYKHIENLKKQKQHIIKSFAWRRDKENNTLNMNINRSENIDDYDKEEIEDEDLLLEETGESKDNEDKSDLQEEIEKFTATKIYICSRTHSQLSQFVGEIRKSSFKDDIRVVSLASRQNYCINSSVKKLKHNALINEKCLDLQKHNTNKKVTKTDQDGKCLKRKKAETKGKCPFFKHEKIDDLRDSITLEVQDIEDLITSASKLCACPYYASRKAVDNAEVILVPYNTILHKATREANGIKLRENVVIIDEAHNLLDALAQMHGATITQEQLHCLHQQLKAYKLRYSKRFSAGNLLCINQLLTIVSSLKIVFDKNKGKAGDNNETQVVTVTDFVSLAEIDHFNMFKLVEFAKNSKLSHKLHGFALRHDNSESKQIPPNLKAKAKKISKETENENDKKEYLKFVKSIDEELSQSQNEKQRFSKSLKSTSINKTKTTNKTNNCSENESQNANKTLSNPNPLLPFISFLETLQNSSSDGRILIHFPSSSPTDINNKPKLQYLLLNPSLHFSDIVRESRAVIVAGGTMKPMSEFRDRLFINSGADASRIMHFSCDHIVPPENILPIIFTNSEFLFNFHNRFKMSQQIKQTLLSACNYIQGGIVVFFPSYKYESWVWGQLKEVAFNRQVFRESQDSSVDKVLSDYHRAIYKSQNKNAMLFSVVGGKLSEGLNFSDDLGRCVIVFGLPYANINSPDLKEKMMYLDKSEGNGAGKKFYESLCMKSVNQCIGRSVRHINDYATVLLVDVRYNRQATKNALPDWIKRSLKTCDYNQAFVHVKEFFESKKSHKL